MFVDNSAASELCDELLERLLRLCDDLWEHLEVKESFYIVLQFYQVFISDATEKCNGNRN